MEDKALDKSIWKSHLSWGAIGIGIGVILLFALDMMFPNMMVASFINMCEILVVISVVYQNIFYTVMSVLFCRSLSIDNREYNKLAKVQLGLNRIQIGLFILILVTARITFLSLPDLIYKATGIRIESSLYDWIVVMLILMNVIVLLVNLLGCKGIRSKGDNVGFSLGFSNIIMWNGISLLTLYLLRAIT